MEDFTVPTIEKVKLEVKEAYQEIYDLIGHNNEACKFVLMYGDYVEMIDDIVDEPKNPALILKAFNHAMALFSLPFWIQNHQALILVDCLINNEYADSLEWEKSEEGFKQADAKVMSHCGYNMMFAVVLLVSGYEGLRKISAKFRQWAHLKHRLPNH